MPSVLDSIGNTPLVRLRRLPGRAAQHGHTGIGHELVAALPRVDAFCGMVGTAGMLMGAGAVLRTAFPAVRIVALEPAGSPVLSGGVAGSHGVDGTGAGFVPPQFDRGLALADEAGPEGVVVTVACHTGFKYLSGTLFQEA